MCKMFMSNFLRIKRTKNHYSRLIFDRVIQKIKRWTFWGNTGYNVAIELTVSGSSQDSATGVVHMATSGGRNPSAGSRASPRWGLRDKAARSQVQQENEAENHSVKCCCLYTAFHQSRTT